MVFFLSFWGGGGPLIESWLTCDYSLRGSGASVQEEFGHVQWQNESASLPGVKEGDIEAK